MNVIVLKNFKGGDLAINIDQIVTVQRPDADPDALHVTLSNGLTAEVVGESAKELSTVFQSRQFEDIEKEF